MTYDTINDAVTRAGGAGALLANRYRIVKQLGQGGMGSVWLAEDTQLDNKPFAIKMLPSILVSNKRAYRQLKDEALVAMQLVHPNIVQVRAFEENDGNPFFVMDYVDGQTLDDYLAERGTLTENGVIRVLRPVAAALDYAHKKGVVHRDVKPGNVMIAKDGTPYVLDFGIAREIQETMTRVTGKLSSGTLLYMSPEQLMGESPKPAQDVYSFAAMAYECLKGATPFSHGQIEFQIMNKQPEPLRSDGALAVGIMAGLAKKPEDRPATCAAVLERNDFSRKERKEHKEVGGPRSVAALGGSCLPRPNGKVGAPLVGSRVPRDRSGGSRSRAVVKGILVATLFAASAFGVGWWTSARVGKTISRGSQYPDGGSVPNAPLVPINSVENSVSITTTKPSDKPVVATLTDAEPRELSSVASSVEQSQSAEVLARVHSNVPGVIKEIWCKTGDIVEKGQIIAKVDDVNYRIIADKCKADLVRAEAENGRAERFFERIKKADARGITIKERDDAEACAEKTRAAVHQARACLAMAELNLKKTQIVAPASGNLRLDVNIGETVSASSLIAEILFSDSQRKQKAELNQAEAQVSQSANMKSLDASEWTDLLNHGYRASPRLPLPTSCVSLIRTTILQEWNKESFKWHSGLKPIHVVVQIGSNGLMRGYDLRSSSGDADVDHTARNALDRLRGTRLPGITAQFSERHPELLIIMEPLPPQAE